MSDDLHIGQKILAFDKIEWALAGRPEDDSPFWHVGYVRGIHEAHHSVPKTVSLTWERGGTSHGHRPINLKPIVENDVFTPEVLEAQDGKKVPLTLGNGGPVIGEATLHYDTKSGNLIADFEVTDPGVEDFLRGSTPPYRREKFIGETEST